MSISLYDTTVRTFIRQLSNLSAFLKKAEQWCEDNGKPHAYLLEARLAPDMYPLPFQVRACTNSARNGTLLAENWKYTDSHARPDDEHTFEGLQARVQKTLEWLRYLKPEDLDGGEKKPLSVWLGGESDGTNFVFETGHHFLMQIAFPEFWFHESMAYAICRMKGVPLGKGDFILEGAPLDGCEIKQCLPSGAKPEA